MIPQGSMRILATNNLHYLPISGVNEVVNRIGKQLVNRGHEYTVLTLNISSSAAEEYSDGVKIISLPYCKHNALGYESFNVISYLKDHVASYDLVNIHNYYSLWSPLVAYFCKRNLIPSVFTPHFNGVRGTKTGIFPHLYDLFSLVGRLPFRWVDRTICTSEYEKGLIGQITSVSASRFTVVPLGVDEVVTRDRRHPATDDTITLLYVGNLVESKGIQYVIRSLPYLRDQLKQNIRLRIVGDGSYKASLENLIESLHLERSTEFYYNLSREELNRLYAEADLFVFMSRCECYGLVVAEALAKGVPSIVSDIAALSEFLKEPGCFGVRYPPDPRELAELIVSIHKKNVAVGPLSHKVRAWDRVAEDYERIYEETIRTHSTGPKLAD